MIYIQTDISIESIKVGGTVAKGVARKLILTNNSLHTASTAYVRDINDDPYLYELMPIDGLGFDFADYLPGEYTLAVIGEEDEVLVENTLVLRAVDNMEIFYDEEYPAEVIDQIPVISLEILDTINGEVIGVSYADKTQAILESVLAIKAAIEEKGEEVGDDPLRTYADHIRNIETGSPATITIKQGDNEQSFQLNQKNDQTIEIVEGIPHWFGTREEYDAIEVKDPDTIYHIEGGDEPTNWDDIQNKPDFKPVATSGSYNDLDDKPTIEPVYNSFITIIQGGEEKGRFSLNQSNSQSIEIDMGGDPHWFGTQAEYDAIPVKDPDTIYHIEGGSDDKHWFGTQAEYDAIPVKDPDMIYCIEGSGSINWDDIQNKPDFKPVATSGDYNDLNNKPEIPSIEGLASEQWVEEQGYLTEHQDISGKVDRSELAPVATSGDYNDLNNKPEIPSIEGLASEQWVEEQGYLTEHQDISGKVDRDELAPVATTGNYNDLTNKPEIPSVEGLAQKSYVDNELSKKQNVIPDLATIRSNAQKGATAVQPGQLGNYATKDDIPEVNNPTITIRQGDFDQTFSLNQSNGKIITITGGSGEDTHHWFGTREEYDAIEHDPSVIYHVQEQISYNDLKDKPTIPTKTSDLQNDSEFATKSYVDEQIGNINSILENI